MLNSNRDLFHKKKIIRFKTLLHCHGGSSGLFLKVSGKNCLNILCDSFTHGYLLAELHSPFLEKNSKHHDAVKHTNATFGWGTKSGTEFLALEPRMKFVSETSYNEKMKKYTIRGKLFAIIGKNINNRIAVFRW